jgi:GNAT superfamily N-acetyltransferase
VDLLVRLYDLPTVDAETSVPAAGIVVRRAIGPERRAVVGWVEENFGSVWAGECEVAFSQPVTTWVAIKEGALVGFACHDASAKGFFGPTGVDESQRGQGIGEALLMATLRGMWEAGYAYAVIGSPGPVEFYQKRLDTLTIPGSNPGLYRDMLRPKS